MPLAPADREIRQPWPHVSTAKTTFVEAPPENQAHFSAFAVANGLAESALNQIRDWLKAGCTISATDPKGRILEMLPDGTMNGGLTIVWPNNEESNGSAANNPKP